MELATSTLTATPVDVLRNVSPLQTGAMKKAGVSREEMAKKAKEFEGIFMAQMLKPMWEGVETDPLFGGGTGEDVMRDMLVQEYGKSMAQSDNFGLSNAVLDVMLRVQEQSQTGERS